MNIKSIDNYFIQIKNYFDFYDFENLSSYSSNGIRISFSDNYEDVIYCDIVFGANIDKYTEKEELLTEFLCVLIEKLTEEKIIVVKYNDKWVVNNSLSSELCKVLRANKINNKLTTGIVIDKDLHLIKLFAKSVLKYNSFVEFLLPNLKAVIAITDHMDLFIDAVTVDVMLNVQELLEQFNRDKGKKVFECKTGFTK